MTRAPRVTGKQIVAALSRAGFVVERVRGSHHFLRHPDGRVTVVPIHGGEITGPGLPTSILRTCELTVEEFRALLG